jgi:hypothetical protein
MTQQSLHDKFLSLRNDARDIITQFIDIAPDKTILGLNIELVYARSKDTVVTLSLDDSNNPYAIINRKFYPNSIGYKRIDDMGHEQVIQIASELLKEQDPAPVECAEVSGSHASYFIDFTGKVLRTEETCDCLEGDIMHAIPNIRYFNMHEWGEWHNKDWRGTKEFDLLDLGGMFMDGETFDPSPSHRKPTITLHFAEAVVRDIEHGVVQDNPRDVRFGTGYLEHADALTDSDWDRDTYYFFDSIEEMVEFAKNCPQALDSDTWVESMEIEYTTVNTTNY